MADDNFPNPRVMMFRCLLSTLLVLPALFASAQEKPKAPPRIAISNPLELKDDPDFAIQGEYVGKSRNSDNDVAAAQVIARGTGQFEVKLYQGGLPGDGWNGRKPEVLLAERKKDQVQLWVTKAGQVVEVGTIETEKLVLHKVAELKKVERTSPSLGAKPPEGATVLFAKEGDETNWTKGKIVELSDGKFLNNGITSQKEFGAFTAHIEFRLPWMPNSKGQQRGNSGVYLQNRYELQVLDSFGLAGENNECGGFYTLHKPKVNICLPPMIWQTYDIEFTPAVYDGEKKVKNARATVKQNGILIQDDVELSKSTGGGQPEATGAGPFQLQNHGDPVVYRNIWVQVKK
jgi:hypothetical protein